MTILSSPILTSRGFNHGFGTRQTAADELPARIYTINQVHGDRVIVLSEPMPAKINRFAQGDALVTSLSGIFIGVRTADCLPVLIADTASGTVAAVHCGWRGLAARIVSRAVTALLQQSGAQAGSLVAALGPSIGVCCYEVGEDVKSAFMKIPGGALSIENRNGSIHANLEVAATAQLTAAGVMRENIDSTGCCTSCRRDLFYSFRGEKTDKRMISFISPPGQALR